MRRVDRSDVEALLDNLDDFIWSVDLNFAVVTANRSVREAALLEFGIRVQPGMLPHELMPTLDAQRLPAFYQRALKEGTYSIDFELTSGVIVALKFSPILRDGQAVGVSVVGQDVTEQREADRQRELAERSYRDLVQNTLAGMFRTTLDGRLLKVNPALMQMWGYGSESELFASVKNVAQDVWTDSNHREEMLKNLLQYGQLRGLEAQIKRKDGATLIVSSNLHLVRNERGEPIAIEGFATDITESRQNEIARMEAERMYRQLFERATVGILRTTYDGRPLMLNPALARMTGYESVFDFLEHVKSLRDDFFVDGNERGRMIEELMTRGEIHNYEKEVRCKDGSSIWVSSSVSLSRDERGNPLQLDGFLIDITERKLAEEAIRSSEDFFRRLFDESGAILLLINPATGAIVNASRAARAFYGYTHEQMKSLSVWHINVNSRQRCMELLADVALQQLVQHSFRHRLRNGEIREVESFNSNIEWHGEKLLLSIVSDVTERKMAERSLLAAQESLRVSEQRYRMVFEMTQDAIYLSRIADGVCFDCNKAFHEMTGYERSELLGHSTMRINLWVDETDRERMREELIKNGACRNIETQFRRRNGTLFWGQLSASRIDLDGIPCIFSVIRDISEAKLAEKEIRQLAFYDSLSGLANRRLLMDRLAHSAGSARRSGLNRALLFIDLDNFKILNDTHGHLFGDQLLCEVARRLLGCVRSTDTVARLGGDEFVIMLVDLNEDIEGAALQTKMVAEKVHVALRTPILLGEIECTCNGSIGITMLEDANQPVEEMLQQADIAMYQAKSMGRDTYRFFVPSLQEAVQTRATLEDELRKGLIGNQFELYYQPQVCEGRVAGAEVLMRWHHPKRGLLKPGEFIHVAEDKGLILPMGKWAIAASFAQLAKWQKDARFARMQISVNISARQMSDADFVEYLMSLSEMTHARPRQITLELTESMMFDNVDDRIEKIYRLREYGFKFSLDDFGIGYSTLASLKRLPLSQVKIDQVFVKDLLEDGSNAAIAQSIITLARALGVEVMAEGVETKEQYQMLRSMGCSCFQGYYFGAAMTADEFERKIFGEI